MTTLRISPDTLILAFLSERTQATAPAIQAACRMTPGAVRSRLAHLESLRHITGRQDARLIPPTRTFMITNEGRPTMITGRQIREARVLLGLVRSELAAKARAVTTATIRRAESVDDEPPITSTQATAIQQTLECLGVEFSAEGVRLRTLEGASATAAGPREADPA